MAESTAALSTSSGHGVTEHSFSRLVPGDPANIRRRMIDALEHFNYVILNLDPIQATRDGSFSMNVLNCALKVIVTFRQSSPLSTTVTFSYSIPLSMLTKGDLRTVEREAEALIALSNRRQNDCVICGTSNAGDSKFCRVCGNPNSDSSPAEVEVMRLTAGARAGQQTLITGLLVILVTILALALPLIFIGDIRRETVIWVLLILGQITGWALLFYGILRLHRTLNPKTIMPASRSRDVTHNIQSVEPASLPPQSAQASITEGTTELLDARSRERTATPVERLGADTGSMN